MAVEIERKFLVVGDAWRDVEGKHIRQAYLCLDEGRTVRVRTTGDRAFLTIKGPAQGISRDEFEYAIPFSDAEHLLQLCAEPAIEKIRREVPFKGFVWEVDEFFGANAGLVIAEIELDTESEEFALPEWVGAEVTDDARYFNSALALAPYSTWTRRGPP